MDTAADPRTGQSPPGPCDPPHNAPAEQGCAAAPGSVLDGPISHAISRVARLHRITAGKLLRDLDLYPGQEFLMAHLWDSGAVRQSELIKSVGLDPSTVTKMLQRLEQAGHVRRRQDPSDRRASLVEATESSCALLHQVRDAWTQLERRSLAGLDEEECAELARLLSHVERNLCTEASGAGEAGGCTLT
ncbi:MarR family winged helix-turn-helix transcriptional regulator [Streptomyces sp. NPDC006879]|uniref:MarR family winged helix-turn-helix transcriptional regulator n=1 Tax=Streptomyces sp. NPDC006879 TaxID=3364767 RepID=UPI003695F180